MDKFSEDDKKSFLYSLAKVTDEMGKLPPTEILALMLEVIRDVAPIIAKNQKGTELGIALMTTANTFSTAGMALMRMSVRMRTGEDPATAWETLDNHIRARKEIQEYLGEKAVNQVKDIINKKPE